MIKQSEMKIKSKVILVISLLSIISVLSFLFYFGKNMVRDYPQYCHELLFDYFGKQEIYKEQHGDYDVKELDGFSKNYGHVSASLLKMDSEELKEKCGDCFLEKNRYKVACKLSFSSDSIVYYAIDNNKIISFLGESH